MVFVPKSTSIDPLSSFAEFAWRLSDLAVLLFVTEVTVVFGGSAIVIPTASPASLVTWIWSTLFASWSISEI